MAYSPPSSDAIDFSIESYTAPSSDAIDFTVGGSTDSSDTVTKTALVSGTTSPTTTVVGNEQRETLTKSITTKSSTTPALRVPLATVTSLSTESLSTVQTVSQIAGLTGGQSSTTPFNILEITDNTVGKDDPTNVLYLRPSFTVEYDRDSTEVIYNND